jgi:hypothetical protein
MSCCGNKRKEWLNETHPSTITNVSGVGSDLAKTDKPNKEFEYTGDYPIIVVGVASGKAYHFRYKGDRVIVEYLDAFSMMAERYLEIVKPDKKK